MSINISELIWTVICFFVLLVVLKKLLFDPLVSFMAARDARIQDGISAGRTAQQQLDAAAQARSDAQRRQSAAADALLAEGARLPASFGTLVAADVDELRREEFQHFVQHAFEKFEGLLFARAENIVEDAPASARLETFRAVAAR